jgi:hypothetical protein
VQAFINFYGQSFWIKMAKNLVSGERFALNALKACMEDVRQWQLPPLLALFSLFKWKIRSYDQRQPTAAIELLSASIDIDLVLLCKVEFFSIPLGPLPSSIPAIVWCSAGESVRRRRSARRRRRKRK